MLHAQLLVQLFIHTVYSFSIHSSHFNNIFFIDLFRWMKCTPSQPTRIRLEYVSLNVISHQKHRFFLSLLRQHFTPTDCISSNKNEYDIIVFCILRVLNGFSFNWNFNSCEAVHIAWHLVANAMYPIMLRWMVTIFLLVVCVCVCTWIWNCVRVFSPAFCSFFNTSSVNIFN